VFRITKNIRVALVDDSKVFRETVKGFLVTLGNITVVAEIPSVTRLLTILEKTKPELILLDIRLGKVNSLNWVEKIKEVLPESIIFVLTSYDYPMYRIMAQEAGISEYILKKNIVKVLSPSIRKHFK